MYTFMLLQMQSLLIARNNDRITEESLLEEVCLCIMLCMHVHVCMCVCVCICVCVHVVYVPLCLHLVVVT